MYKNNPFDLPNNCLLKGKIDQIARSIDNFIIHQYVKNELNVRRLCEALFCRLFLRRRSRVGKIFTVTCLCNVLKVYGI